MPSFVFESDAIPETWQFLIGLRRDDLFAELIQNELDAGSTCTKIRFEKDKLICQGNGEPIDPNGWTRLRFFRGAGDRAPRKHAKTGVKNHGLKACFTISNDIIIRSAGKFTQQTLCDPKHSPKPYPGAMEEPEFDDTAPETGCRIEIPYRSKDLQVNVGEPLTLPRMDPESTDEWFDAICSELPLRFLGVVRPKMRPRYEIVVSHWKHGEKRFLFSARSRKQKGNRSYIRTCRIKDATSSTTATHREHVCILSLPKRLVGIREVPEFYQGEKGLFAEVSWAIDSRSKPIYSIGQLRYPIAYVGSESSASSGICASYSAPFVSDAERHGISPQASQFNGEIIQRCDQELARILRDQLIPRYGPSVLSLICNGEVAEQRRRGFVELLLQQRAIPIVSDGVGSQTQILHGTRLSKGKKWSFIIPCYSWCKDRISLQLSAVTPSKYMQLHPQTPSIVIRELVESVSDCCLARNDDSRYTVFDESDVFRLIRGESDEGLDFPWEEKWANKFSTPKGSRLLFDVLNETEGNDQLNSTDRMAIKNAWEVPNENGTLTSFAKLFSAREVTDYPPGTSPPDLIHRDLSNHQLLRKKNWKLNRFGLAELFDSVSLQGQPLSDRKRFWHWTKTNWPQIPQRIRRKLSGFPIWPTVMGKHITLSEMCYLKRKEIRQILRSVLHEPAPSVFKIQGVRVGGRGALSIRSKVLQENMDSWFEDQIQSFEKDQQLASEELLEFMKFEAAVAKLCNDRDSVSMLQEHRFDMLAMDQTGVLRVCSDLHRETEKIRNLGLRSEDLIQRKKGKLDPVFPPRIKPSFEALRRSLINPLKSTTHWQIRLAAYVKVCEQQGKSSLVNDAACILVEGEWLKPRELALRGRKGDYWGSWKTTIGVKGRSAEEQELLRKVGVTPGEPTTPLSRDFFLWLKEKEARLSENRQQIIRHFGHRNGVLSWWKEHPDIPCIPVLKDRNLRLVSLSSARTKSSRVCIDDFPELALKMRDTGCDLEFVLDRHPSLDISIVDRIRDCQIRRLSHVANEPIQVRGVPKVDVDKKLHDAFEYLKSRNFKRELPSRLAHWEIPVEFLHNNWQSRLSAIEQIEMCSEVNCTFRVGKRHYSISLPSRFDSTCGTLYVVDTEKGKRTALFDATSEYLFRFDAPKMAKAAFERAAFAELPEWDGLIADPFDESIDEEAYPDDGVEDLDESRTTHHRKKDRGKFDLPDPHELSHGNREISAGAVKSQKDDNASPTIRPRAQSEIEHEHRRQLKETYAWHCQVCLASKEPSELAPMGSYVFLQENRRCLIEAHHPDQVHAGGARHGGNLLIVCQAHHTQFGDTLTRAELTDAIETAEIEKNITFASESGIECNLKGLVVEVPIKTSGVSLQIFFARQHSDYWIDPN